jgi:hypothetical protein
MSLAGVSVYVGSSTIPVPEATLANLWVDDDGGTCTRSDTLVAYDDAAACGSASSTSSTRFQTAYNAASCGDTVNVKAGTYNGQQMLRGTLADTCDGNPVTFAAAPNETVLLQANSVTDANSLALGVGAGTSRPPRDLIFDGIDYEEGFYVFPGARRIEVANFEAQNFTMRCGVEITVSDGLVTNPLLESGVPRIAAVSTSDEIATGETDACDDGDASESKDIVIDGVRFYQIWPQTSDDHLECLHVMGVTGLIVRNSIFEECHGNTAALSFNEDSTTDMQDILVENNLFWKTTNVYTGPGELGTGVGPSIATAAETQELTIRFNTMVESGHFTRQATPAGDGIIIDSNVWDSEAMHTGRCIGVSQSWVWRYNIAGTESWAAACNDDGGTNQVASVAFANEATGDFRLAGGSVAVDEGNPSGPPATDFEGTSRPLGGAPDAGMDELE